MSVQTQAQSPSPAATGGHRFLAPRYKAWLVVLLLAVSTLNFADRAVLSVLAQSIKEDLKLTDADLGMLQGLGFAILYSVLGLPLGWLAERVSRKGLIAVCVAIWSFMSMASGLAGGFGTLLLSRVGVGIGEAGFQPSTSSLVADHFKADRRGSILAVILLGAPFGFLLGQSVGGWVASQWNWRAAFFALGAPGLLAALLVALTLREPPRGLVDGRITADKAPPLNVVLRELWSKRSFRHLLVAATVSGFTSNAVAQFVLPFYLRSFGLPLAVVGVVFGTIAFTSNGLGIVGGGFGFDWLSRRDARWSMWGPAAAVLAATPLYIGAFASPGAGLSLVLIWLSNLVLASYSAPMAAAVQNLVGPRMRAFTAAFFALAIGLVGAGLGPTVLGIVSDLFARHAFHVGSFIAQCPGGRAGPGAPAALDAACRAASTEGLRRALISVQPLYLWAAIHFVLAARSIRADLYSPVADR
jgi:predicted MFS family arabinose efflux permease